LFMSELMEAKKLAHALQVWPRLLLFVCVLLTPTCLRAASGAVTPEHEARAQKLLQDNLRPTLAFWENLRAAHGGRKLSMQSFFKLVHANIGSRFTGVWGIKNNKVFQLDKEGELRYDKEQMIKESKPNRGAAESLKASLWLAIEDAPNYGVRLPDCVFVYNAADSPMCGHYSRVNCSDYTYAPTLSIMSLDPDIMRKLRPESAPKVYPDLLVPLFRYLGYSLYTTVGNASHHEAVLQRMGKGQDWTVANRVVPTKFSWEDKTSKLFFRGNKYCPHLRQVVCPRLFLTNLSIHNQDRLDILCGGLGQPYLDELREHGWPPRRYDAMPMWNKYKYLASLDGLAGSSRILPLLHSGSVVVRQQLSPYLEWFYKSLQPGVHYEEIFKVGPNGEVLIEDALELVDKLHADDAYAQRLAHNALEFAQTYLVREVMFLYLKGLLEAYLDLFDLKDMQEYLASVDDPGNPQLFKAQARAWKQDWRTVRLS